MLPDRLGNAPKIRKDIPREEMGAAMPKSRGQSHFLSLPEAATYLGIGHRTMRRHVAEGHITAYRAPGGRALKFRRDDVEQFMQPIPAVGGVSA